MKKAKQKHYENVVPVVVNIENNAKRDLIYSPLQYSGLQPIETV